MKQSNGSRKRSDKSRIGYLPCQAEPGMFKGEFLVYLDGLDPSAPEKSMRVQMLVDQHELESLSGTPKRNDPATGWLRVAIARKLRGGILEVVLPQPAQPVGESMLVNSDQLKTRAGA